MNVFIQLIDREHILSSADIDDIEKEKGFYFEIGLSSKNGFSREFQKKIERNLWHCFW